MSVALSTIILIVSLSLLIAVHEWGHFIAARLCKIKVREFAIGMGPVFFSRQKKDQAGNPLGTRFTLRAFPIGGFCDMGEDESSDDPGHFRNKTIGQKIFVLVAGALMNIIVGFVVLLVMNLLTVGWHEMVPTVTNVEAESPYAEDFQVGDRFYKINGQRIFNYTDFSIFYGRDSDQPYSLVLIREGEKVFLENISKVPMVDFDEDGNPLLDESGEPVTRNRMGISVGGYQEVTLASALQQSCFMTVDYVRLVWVSLGDLISGRAKVDEMMGPVGMGGMVNDIIETPQISLVERVVYILNFMGLIAVNLAVMNLLPIPALDGGRIVFLFVSVFLMKVRKRPLSEKVEGYIHGVTMLLLFGLMIFIFYNDIVRMVTKAVGDGG